MYDYEEIQNKKTTIYIEGAYIVYDTETSRMYIAYGKTHTICGEILCEKHKAEIRQMYPYYFVNPY